MPALISDDGEAETRSCRWKIVIHVRWVTLTVPSVPPVTRDLAPHSTRFHLTHWNTTRWLCECDQLVLARYQSLIRRNNLFVMSHCYVSFILGTFRSLRFTMGWPLKSCTHTGIFPSVSGPSAVKRKLRKVPIVKINIPPSWYPPFIIIIPVLDLPNYNRSDFTGSTRHCIGTVMWHLLWYYSVIITLLLNMCKPQLHNKVNNDLKCNNISQEKYVRPTNHDLCQMILGWWCQRFGRYNKWETIMRADISGSNISIHVLYRLLRDLTYS